MMATLQDGGLGNTNVFSVVRLLSSTQTLAGISPLTLFPSFTSRRKGLAIEVSGKEYARKLSTDTRDVLLGILGS